MNSSARRDDHWKRPSDDANVRSTKRRKEGFVLTKLNGDSQRFPMRTNDDIHGTIDICPVMKALIDTPHMQRLRSIKQLGTTYLVYMNAKHDRFEHSLGVAELARKMCNRIKEVQPNLGTTHKDVLCVTLAGLLHDIGHGPFSHIYDTFRGQLSRYLEKHPDEKAKYDKFGPEPENWKHEDTSLAMIDALLKYLGLEIDLNSSENLDKPLKQIGDGIDATTMRVFKCENELDEKAAILTSRDFIFIKECIKGEPLREVKEKLGISGFIGRLQPKKEWLYDVVANRFSGLDVDKMDYFARDAKRTLAIGGPIDQPILYNPLVAIAECSKDNCERCRIRNGYHHMICYPKKSVEAAITFFQRRYQYHDKVYQHKTSAASALLLCDMLRLADLHCLIHGDVSGPVPISRALFYPDAFVNLNDDIVGIIKASTSPELAAARQLAKRLDSRKIYKSAGDYVIRTEEHRGELIWSKSENEIASEIIAIPGKHSDKEETPLCIDDIVVEKCSYHYGRKKHNPLLDMCFVDRDDLDEPLQNLPKAKLIDASDYLTSLPQSFEKNSIRVFCRDDDPKKRDLLHHKFEQWKEAGNETSATPGNIHETCEEALEYEDSSMDSGRSPRCHDLPPALMTQSQQSDDDETPRKPPRSGEVDGSPVPFSLPYR